MEAVVAKLLSSVLMEELDVDDDVIQDIARKQLALIMPLIEGGGGSVTKKKKEKKDGPAAWYKKFKTIEGDIVIKADIDEMAKANGQTLTARNKCFSTLPEGSYKGWKGFYKACQKAFDEDDDKNCSTYGAAALLFRMGGLTTVQAESGFVDEEDLD